MSDEPSSPPPRPVDLVDGKDVTASLDALGSYDFDRVLKRDGSIDIELKGTRFQVTLTNAASGDAYRPARSPRPAEINLTEEALQAIVQEIRQTWTNEVVNRSVVATGPDGEQKRRRLYQEALEPDIDDETFRILAGALAVAGEKLFTLIFERTDKNLQKVADRLKEMVRSGECVFTVNSEHFHIPWGMLYTHPSAGEKLRPDGANFDPRGFWGYQHIFEQFTNDHDITNRLTAIGGKLPFGAAVHDLIDKTFNVQCVAQHKAFVTEHGERLAYVEWTTKPEVGAALGAWPFDHRVIYFLCHAEVGGELDKPRTGPPRIELADAMPILPSDVSFWIARNFEGNQPLVFLNACQAGQVTTLLYRQFTFATEFLARGASCVVGPQIEVPAVFAGEFGRRFFEELVQPAPAAPQVGTTLRKLTREFWAKRNPLGLVYSLYAGADCHVHWPAAEAAKPS